MNTSKLVRREKGNQEEDAHHIHSKMTINRQNKKTNKRIDYLRLRMNENVWHTWKEIRMKEEWELHKLLQKQLVRISGPWEDLTSI